jgi:hypothetical protein
MAIKSMQAMVLAHSAMKTLSAQAMEMTASKPG